jgi:hypothetical protein
MFLIVQLCYPVSINLNTINTFPNERPEFEAIIAGAKVFLKKREIHVDVTEREADFTVWLKNLERLFKGNDLYSYEFTVILSFPSQIEKKALKTKNIRFEISLVKPLEDEEREIEQKYRYGYERVKKRLKREAYIGGKAVADCIEDFLRSMGVLK